jgi:hypothetical protein
MCGMANFGKAVKARGPYRSTSTAPLEALVTWDA